MVSDGKGRLRTKSPGGNERFELRRGEAEGGKEPCGIDQVKAALAGGNRVLVAGGHGRYFEEVSAMTRAGLMKEIPWPERAPIITASTTGGCTGVAACQRTIKLAPKPPLVSVSLI
ncbi:hypothetical protein DBW_3244 [Desulfuromonas sp. DDH964]|nr:hypothetical protein DBW_3244 [Desulfuromonas sp. DDH964]